MIHPLYLFAPPLMKSVTGTLSQLVYLSFIYSVLSIPNSYVEEAEPAVSAAEPRPLGGLPGEDWNKSVCTMEMDRLIRLIDAKVQEPILTNTIRGDISDYINKSQLLNDDIQSGISHYNAILLQAAATVRRLLAENPAKPGAPEVFLFIADEMLKMEYITPTEREILDVWLSNIVPHDPAPQEYDSTIHS
jgi:hypothetical protein